MKDARSLLNRPDRGGARPISNDADDDDQYDRDYQDPDDVDATTDEGLARKHEFVVREALERTADTLRIESKQRKSETEDLKFDRALPEDHWPSEILAARTKPGDGEAPRPCLVIPRLGLPVQQILNEAKRSKLSVRLRPKPDTGATQAGALLRQKAYRAIEQDSHADIARYWALERAAKCGRGYYRVLTTYANDTDTDLDIRIVSIPNQGSVIMDPFHKDPSGRDAQWCILTDQLPKREYQRTYKQTKLAQSLKLGDSGDWELDEQNVSWLAGDTVRIAEYFRVVRAARQRIFVPTEGGYVPMWDDDEVYVEDPDLLKHHLAMKGVRVRKVERPTVEWYVLNGLEVIEYETWPGRFIPVIQVPGRMFNVDGERTYKGATSDGKDSQRQYNYMRSALVEQVLSSTLAPWVMAEGQDHGYEEMWDNANRRNYSRLKYKPTTHEGHLVGAPQRNTADPPIQALTVAVQMANDDLQWTTGRNDSTAGKYRSGESGIAHQRRVEQAEQASSNYLDNLATISMPYEADIVTDLMSHVYDRHGRIVRLVGEEGDEDEYGLIGVPFTTGPEGEPVPMEGGMQPAPGGIPPPAPSMMPPGMPPGPPMSPGMPPPVTPTKVKHYTFDDGGQFAIVVDVGPNSKTQKDANSEVIGRIMEAAPAIAQHVADLYAQSLEGPMAAKLAARIKKLSPIAAEPDEQTDMPPAAQAQIYALKQQLQQATQQLQAMQADLAARKYAVDADVAIAKELAASRERVAALSAETQRFITSQRVESAEEVAKLKADADMAMQTVDHAHDRLVERRQQESADANQAADRIAAAAEPPASGQS